MCIRDRYQRRVRGQGVFVIIPPDSMSMSMRRRVSAWVSPLIQRRWMSSAKHVPETADPKTAMLREQRDEIRALMPWGLASIIGIGLCGFVSLSAFHHDHSVSIPKVTMARIKKDYPWDENNEKAFFNYTFGSSVEDSYEHFDAHDEHEEHEH
eukprot:TRINITY_DN2713_c0_g1_i1.p1 TRINITY_DN2713_c0_g1~~TRINITY_DN2713_c0_g1_i1.p1  ORF type:complete len:153 (-),score=25.70 TRINITY_DN2713_c0_g1_i1:104-562(-)